MRTILFLLRALRSAALAAVLVIAAIAQTITLPGQSTPVSLTWLYYNKMRWAGAWSSATTYNPQDVVTYSGLSYVSLSAANLNNGPATSPAWWTVLPNNFSLPAGSQLQLLRIAPNTATTVYEFASPPVFNVLDYAFPAQAPGGSLLAGGVGQSATLAPCPLGVAGTDSNHALYISGGVGTAEPVLITGGTCTSGAASGTVVFTPANAHSGAWTITSASAGIQEAILVAGNGSVYIPAGTYNTQATITVPTTISPEIYGAGGISSMICPQFASGDVITYASPTVIGSFSIHDLAFSSGARSSGAFIGQRGGVVSGTIRDIYTSGGYDAVVIEGGNGCFTRNLHLLGYSHYGVYIHATATTGGRHEGWTMSGGAASVANLAIQVDAGGSVAGMQFSDLSLQTGQFNILANASAGVLNELEFCNMILDSATTFAVRFMGASGGNGIHFLNVRGSTGSTGGLVDLYSGFSDFTIVNGSASVGGPNNGIVLRGAKNVVLSSINVSGGGTGSPNDVALTITSDTGGVACDSIRVENSSFGFSGTGATSGNVATYGLSIPTTGHRNIVFANSSFYGSTAAISDNNDVSPQYVGWIRGLSDTLPTVADAASITFPRMLQGGTVEITGSGTTVTAVAGLYQGQTGFIQTASAITLTAGASIGSSVTTTANTLTPFWFDGTKIWLR